MSAQSSRKSKELLLLCVLGAIAIFSSTMAKSPILVLFASSLGATDVEQGLIGAASPATGVLVSAPIGYLMDRKGARPLLWVAAILFAFVPFLYFFVATGIQLAIVRFIHGMATAILGPVALAVVAQMYGAQRGEKMALYSSSTRVGRTIAPLVGGFLLTVPLFSSLGLDVYRGVYLMCGLFGMGALGATVILSPNLEAQPQQISPETTPSGHGTVRDVLVRDVLLICMAQAATFFLYGAYEYFMPRYWTESVGMPDWGTGVLLALLTLSILVIAPVVGRISDTRGRLPFIVGGLAALSVLIALTVLTTSLLVQIALVIPIGIMIASVDSTTSPLVTERVDPSMKGTALGLLSTIMDVGHSAGPLVLGVLLGLTGHSFLLAFAGASIAILCVPLFVLAGARKSDEQTADNNKVR